MFYWNFQLNGLEFVFNPILHRLTSIFDKIQAQYMDFPKVVRLTQARFLEMLESSKSLEELESRFSFSLFSGHQHQ